MKKNKKSPTPASVAPQPKAPLLTKRALLWIGSGLATLVIGYVVLSFADARAQNAAGKISPFLILGGYAAIGVGLFLNSTPTAKPTDTK